jgi:hypothetical protein
MKPTDLPALYERYRRAKVPYRLLPGHSAQSFARLFHAIRDAGRIMYPVLKDEQGITLDGLARLIIAKNLRLAVPVELANGLTELQKRHLHYSLNCNHHPRLTRKQLREVIAGDLRLDPKQSSRALAKALATTPKTVESVRKWLEASGEIPHMDVREGERNGKPYRFTSVQTPNERVAERVRPKLEALGEEAPDGRLSSWKQVDTLANRKRQRDKERKVVPYSVDDVKAYCCDFRDLAKKAGLQPDSIDLFFTDPPWVAGWLDNWKPLGEFIAKYLKPTGLAMIYTGQHNFSDIFDNLRAAGLHYYWMAAMVRGEVTAGGDSFGGWGCKTLNSERNMIPGFLPVLLMSKGGRGVRGRHETLVPYPTQDTRRVNLKEKSHHGWQRPLPEAEYYIRMLTEPGQLVCDPCLGSGTTALACHHLKRRFVGCDVRLECLNLLADRLREVNERPRQKAG